MNSLPLHTYLCEFIGDGLPKIFTPDLLWINQSRLCDGCWP
ncbi:hypothetical protein PCH70_31540 [Pseudomonas cichorii JBC1]|nr:hypothetical protein PCH70_31540 [Pseudomonas cichorii JBC1]